MSCNCGCTHGHRHPEEQREEPSFLKTYGGMLLSALMLAAGIVLDSLEASFFQSQEVAFGWYLAAYLPVGLPVLKEAWESIRQGSPFSEFTLMSVATFGAFGIGEYPEAVAVMLFYSLGEAFQEKAVDKARRSISVLLAQHPDKAVVLRDGQRICLPPQKVKPGEVIEVKPGERVPLDGRMADERAAFDTAALTGESVPRTLCQGEEVLAGMIATDRAVRIEVTRPFGESSLSRILKLVQEASERKAPAELFIRRFARIYTPIVTGAALLVVLLPGLWSLVDTDFTFAFSDWLYRALVFLVISCPCALVVSIPLSYFGGIGAASRLGILFKGGNYLDAVTEINTVVFDKTGTLTEGSFEVRSCHTAPGTTEETLLRTLASAEQGSTHPAAQAVVRHALGRGIALTAADNVTERAGLGMETTVDGRQILAGNLRLLALHEVAYPPELEQSVHTLVAGAADGKYIGHVLLSDVLKADARQAIEGLKALHITNIQLLSGDKQTIVTTFANDLGITHAYGDLLPEDKVKHLERLKQTEGARIAFVGDGLNDAPVLALSHVGIAMGGLGSDAAIETADVVIQTDRPSRVVTAIEAGRQTRNIVRQNIVMALGIKLLVLVLGVCGTATLWEAVFADVGVALLAIANAIRIQRLIR